MSDEILHDYFEEFDFFKKGTIRLNYAELEEISNDSLLIFTSSYKPVKHQLVFQKLEPLLRHLKSHSSPDKINVYIRSKLKGSENIFMYKNNTIRDNFKNADLIHFKYQIRLVKKEG